MIKRTAIALAALSMCVSLAALAEVTIDEPRGGWRHTGGEALGYRQEVNYPASSVNVGNAPASARIRGRIAAAAKAAAADAPRQPATLIVNGVAMPLSLAEDGSFARPYAFGRGANSVEVRAPGGERRRVAFYDSYAGRTQARLRVVLAWDSDGTDLDLHVVSPDGQHVFYGDRVGANGGALDVDVTTGFGPEIYSNPSPPPGVYHVYVNYYGAGQERDALTTATVTILTQENTLSEKQQTFRIPMRRPGELTLVKSFSYP
jgi:uncharacterized protein YfaP (DUF2135 family)